MKAPLRVAQPVLLLRFGNDAGKHYLPFLL